MSLALRLDEDFLRLSRQHNDYAGLVLGHMSSGRELMYMGRFGSSRLHLEDVLALYDPISRHPITLGPETRWFAAELNRLKCKLLLRQGHTAAAEDQYRRALSIAREQEAKLWELRAAASLPRLWRDQGRPVEARDLLAPVYGFVHRGL